MVDPKIPGIPALQPRKKARLIVAAWVDAHTDKTDDIPPIDPDKDIFVVWFCRTLQNWKALLSTTRPDGLYYELTYDGNQEQTYLDVYKKWENKCIPDEVES